MHELYSCHFEEITDAIKRWFFFGFQPRGFTAFIIEQDKERAHVIAHPSLCISGRDYIFDSTYEQLTSYIPMSLRGTNPKNFCGFFQLPENDRTELLSEIIMLDLHEFYFG